jgi:rSAM/selenodomain-associated transferase 1
MTASPAPLGFGLMCKPPRPGATKTRLAATIGPAAAALLSGAFLADCAGAALDAAGVSALVPMAFYRPANGGAEVSEVLGPHWPLFHADAGDLGATMFEVLGHLLAHCPAGAIIMGADVPLITAAHIAEAATCLREGDDRAVVMIPSVDGGYCLLGLRSLVAAAPLLEPMAWSTAAVLRETLARAEGHGLRPVVLPAQRDIDDIEGLNWLRLELTANQQAAPATRAALASLEILSTDR